MLLRVCSIKKTKSQKQTTYQIRKNVMEIYFKKNVLEH